MTNCKRTIFFDIVSFRKYYMIFYLFIMILFSVSLYGIDAAENQKLYKIKPVITTTPNEISAYLLAQGEQSMIKAKNFTDKEQSNPELPLLLEASKNGQIREFKNLLYNGASVDQCGPGKETALHWAAGYGHKDIVYLLLAKGADVNTTDTSGMTPLHMAAREAQTEVAKLLLAEKAKPDTKNADDMTPLHMAAYIGQSELVKLLLAYGAFIDPQDNTGSTPLHLAAAYDHPAVVILLLKAGANLSIRDNDGNSPKDLANANDHNNIVELIETYEAK